MMWALRLGLCLLACWSTALHAKEALTLGVLAFRSEAKTSEQWKPLEQYLNASVGEYTFTVKAFDLPHLREAVRQSQVDLVLTQPAEYVRMTHENGLSSPLATLLNSQNGKPVRVFGGTIVTRQDHAGIRSLADLHEKTVASPTQDSFGGFQVQAFALKNANVELGPVSETGTTQEAAIQAVLDSQADVAFVRSGLVESLIAEGKLDPQAVRIINQQQFPGYPFAVSTALYPEWPVVALPHVRDETAARVAGALLSLPHQGTVARQIGIHGFSVPSDYESVRTVMRSMKLPPFDVEMRISLLDVWKEYRLQILITLGSILAIAALALRSTLLSHQLREFNETLETRITERTSELAARNVDLANTLTQLDNTRDELVESAKLAALGSMVAGIAHELNTPVGNGLTVATTLEGRTEEFKKEMQTGLRRSTLESFVADTALASDILVRSLDKAATLVSSFKQVAVDQTSSQRRKFKVHDTLAEVIMTLTPTLKQTGCAVKLVEVQEDMELDSYPGPLGQVITNLINNAVLHGYEGNRPGEIRVVVTRGTNDSAVIEVCDDGVGISPANMAHIFEPFFTTRLGKGGSGLGLSIARNMVMRTLGGKLSATSNPGQGTVFTLQIPRVAPEAA